MDCVLLIGVPGAGKTSYFRQRYAATHVQLSMDLLRRSARRKQSREHAELAAALAQGRSVVVDNTNATMAVRAPLIAIAKRHGASVIGVYLEATITDARSRNEQRQGRARVPPIAIFAIARRLEPPIYAEGFDRIVRARVAEGGGFDERDWTRSMDPFEARTIIHAGQTFRHRLYVPPGYDSARAWPLIVFLHGRGECGGDGDRQVTVGLGPALMRHPERWPFLVLFPQKPEPDEPFSDYFEPVLAMLDRAFAEQRVDRSRLYLTGISQGGSGTWAFGAARPDLWAALAPICGFGDPDRLAAPLAAMPIWCFHGADDPVVPVAASARLVAAIGDDSNLRFTRYPNVGHDAWTPAYDEEELPRWLLAHASV